MATCVATCLIFANIINCELNRISSIASESSDTVCGSLLSRHCVAMYVILHAFSSCIINY